MRCENCPAQIVEGGNESDPTTYYSCWYGENYEDKHGRDFADGTYGCLKRRKTIEKDMELDFMLRHPALEKCFTEMSNELQKLDKEAEV